MKNILTALLFFISISLFSQDEKRLALVIGNANYDKGELKNPVNDARLIASTLDSLDFDVILKENLATEREMTLAIREFGNKRSEYDVAFVYYAGHGIQIDDENFLLPTKEEFSSEEDVLDFGVSVQNIMRYLRSQTDEVNILILDACRDNPFESNWNTTRSLKGSGLAKIPPPTGSLIAFSTDSGQTAPDGDGENSIYTISLTNNMLLEDTSIDQVFRNVRAEVLTQTNGIQRPVEATQLTGQSFYLKPRSSKALIKEFDNALINENFELALNLSFQLIINFPEMSSSYEKAGHIRSIRAEFMQSKIYYEKALEIDSMNVGSINSVLFTKKDEQLSLGLIYSTNQLLKEGQISVEEHGKYYSEIADYFYLDADINRIYLLYRLARDVPVFNDLRFENSMPAIYFILEELLPNNNFEKFYSDQIVIYDRSEASPFSVQAIMYNQASSFFEEYASFKKEKKLPFDEELNLALNFANEAIKFESERDPKSKNLSYLYDLKSSIYNRQKKLNAALDEAFKAVELNFNKNKASNYSRISRIYFQLNEQSKAISYANLSIEEELKNNASNSTLIARYYSVGMLHYFNDDFLRAFSYIEAAWKLDNNILSINF